MTIDITTAEGKSTLAGAGVLVAATHMTIMHYGGYNLTTSPLAMMMAVGVYAGANALGVGRSGKGKIVAAMIVGLLAGEAYNFFATAEGSVISRDAEAAPLRNKLLKHQAALKRLQELETGTTTSTRLTLAQQALAALKDGAESARVLKARKDASEAQKAADDEASNVRCGKDCERKQLLADKLRQDLSVALTADDNDRREATTKAEAEVQDAIKAATEDHAKEVEAAKADVEANPLPPSAHPLADCLHMAPWALDLLLAGLRSLGSNGLAAALIAYGARRPDDERTDNPESDFPAWAADRPELPGLFRPDGPSGPGKRGPDRPKRPGPSDGLSREDALKDLLQRLADGETIPSDSRLAKDWNRPKQTVHEWMKVWRKIGVVPTPVQVGRCKQTALAE